MAGGGGMVGSSALVASGALLGGGILVACWPPDAGALVATAAGSGVPQPAITAAPAKHASIGSKRQIFVFSLSGSVDLYTAVGIAILAFSSNSVR